MDKVNHTIRTRCFTLMEIILVVLIIGVISGFAMIRFDNDLPESRLYASARSVASLLQAAHTRAMSKGTIITMEIDLERAIFSLNPWTGKLGRVECPEQIGITEVITSDGAEDDEQFQEIEFNPESVNSSLIISLINEKEQKVSIVFNALIGTTSLHDGVYEDQWLDDVPRF
jgi:Tfp pilus assembly protein FimT